MLIPALVWVVLTQGPAPFIAGTVVGPTGTPVAGAELALVTGGGLGPEVITRVRSDAVGRFSIERPAPTAGGDAAPGPATLWAVAPGHRLAAVSTAKLAGPVVIRLEPPGRAEVRVIGPDSRPVAGSQVRPERLRPWANLPDAIAEAGAATTDAAGLAVLDAVAPADLSYVDIHAPGLGIQGTPIELVAGQPTTITLRAVTAWSARLAAEPPTDAAGWRVRVWTNTPYEQGVPPGPVGYAEVLTDAEGRFACAPIAEGLVGLEFTPPDDRALLPDVPPGLVAREGGQGPATIPLKRASRVAGRFAERGTGRPVAGVGVHLYQLSGNRGGGQNTMSGPDGRFNFVTLPGRVQMSASNVPDSHVGEGWLRWDEFAVPEPPAAVDVGTRELTAAAPRLTGRVVDEAGRPVAGASVQASWQLEVDGKTTRGSSQAGADANGEFHLGGLPPGATARVSASRLARASKDPVEVRAGAAGPITILALPKPVFAAAGRVVGPDGRGVGGVTLSLHHRRPEETNLGFGMQVHLDGNRPLRTEADGSFRSAAELDPLPGSYRIEVVGPGYLPAQTAWLAAPGGGGTLVFPDLAARRLRGTREVAGRVLDIAGRPVAAAMLRPGGGTMGATFARSAADGRFRLANVPEGSALLTAEAPGFRFGGAVVGEEAGPVEVRLARTTEPPVVRLTTLPPVLTRVEERALGLSLIEPILPLARAGQLGYNGTRALPALGRLDPDRVLALIEDRVVPEPLAALLAVAQAQAEDDPARAVATIDDDRDPAARAAGWLALERIRPAVDRPGRVDLLDRALADARRIEGVEARLAQLGRVADRWLDLGEIGRARPILLEGQRTLGLLLPGRWSSEAEEFAEVLAAIDLPAATALFERRGVKNTSAPDPATIARHKLGAATRLAAIDPAAAEGLIEPPAPAVTGRSEAILIIARRMAAVDLPRARRIVARLDDRDEMRPAGSPALTAFGLGRLAAGLAATDPAGARGLLDEAFAGLRQAAMTAPGWYGAESAANLMARLLPVVERVVPDHLAERTWLAAAYGAPLTREPQWQQFEGLAALALLVGRYDRDVAGALLDPMLDRLPEQLAGLTGSYQSTLPETVIRELTALRPGAIEPLIRTLPETARRVPPPRQGDNARESVESTIRLNAAESLGWPPAARTQVAEGAGPFWTPGRGED